MPVNLDCDVNALIAAAKCYQKQCLGPIDWEAMEIYVRVQNLAASGGADYRNSLNALLQASKEYQALPCDTRKGIDLLLTVDNAIDNGASFATDANSLKAGSRCYSCLGIELMKQVNLFLKCALSKLDKPS